MKEQVSDHYGRSRQLIDQIADRLRATGIDPKKLRAADFEPIDEFHFRGRQPDTNGAFKLEATIEQASPEPRQRHGTRQELERQTWSFKS